MTPGKFYWETEIKPDADGFIRVPVQSMGRSYGSYDMTEDYRRMQEVINEVEGRKMRAAQETRAKEEEAFRRMMADAEQSARQHIEDIRTLGDQEMADSKQQNPVIISPTGYLSFANVFEKRAVVQGGEERYSVNLIFDENDQKTEAYKNLQKAILEAAKKFWGDKMPKGINWPLKDAEEKSGSYEGYTPGRKFLSAWTKTAPGVINAKREDILDKDAVWAGQRARLAIKPFAYDKGGNKGVGLVFDSLQIVKQDMPRIDGKAPAKDLFPDDLGDVSDSGGGDDDIPF